jgi:hypothetical protein
MSHGPDPDDRDAQIMARLAELDLSAAERVHAKLMIAEAPAEVAELGRTYQRMARSLRQTLALKAQMKRERERDREQAAREPSPPKKPGGAAVAQRIRELRDGVRRVIWDEAEDAETRDWDLEALDETITYEMQKDEVCAESIDDHVARICLELGLAAERIARWRDLPDPPPDGYPMAEPPPPDVEPPAPAARRESG